MTTKVENGEIKLPIIDDGDNLQSAKVSDRSHVTMTSSNLPLNVVLCICCLIAWNCLSVYQVHKLDGRLQRLEAEFFERGIVKPDSVESASASTPMTSSTPNVDGKSESTSTSDSSSSPPPPSLRVSEATRPFWWLPKSQARIMGDDDDYAGSGVAVGDVDAEDGDVDFDVGYEVTRVVAAPDDVIEGSGAEMQTPDVPHHNQQQNIISYLFDFINADSVETDNLGLVLPAEDIEPARSRRRRSASDTSSTGEVEDDLMLADQAGQVGAEQVSGRDVRRGLGPRQRERQQQQQQQPDARTISDTERTNGTKSRTTDQDIQRHMKGRQKNSSDRQNKESNRKHRYSGTSSGDVTQTSTIKVAHFVAPRQNNHYTSDSEPPVTFPFWKVDNWTSSLGGQNEFYELRDGLVTVLESGVYMVYAQMMYHDASGRWAFGIYVDNDERIKCMNSEQLNRQHGTDLSTGSRNDKVHSVYQHCYTSGLLRLRRYDKVSLRCLYGSKSIIMQPAFTFWGLIKLVPLAD